MQTRILGSCSHTITTQHDPISLGPHVYCPLCTEYVYVAQRLGPARPKAGGVTLGGAITSIVLSSLYMFLVLGALVIGAVLIRLAQGRGEVFFAAMLGYLALATFGIVAGALACTGRRVWTMLSGVIQILFSLSFVYLALDGEAIGAAVGALISLLAATLCFVGWAKDKERPSD